MSEAFVSGRPGPSNTITDLAGCRIGHAEDERLRSGVTVLLFDEPATASVLVSGGAPGTRESDLLSPERTVTEVDALVLSGGSAFGLDAAAGVQAALAEAGRGFAVAGRRVPIVPAAILFDLANGGEKDWGRYPPYREMGYAAARAAGTETPIGAVGAGLGCMTATWRGGLGSASIGLPGGFSVAALVAVNALGSVTMGRSHHFWAAPFEIGNEFGGKGWPSPIPEDASRLLTKLDARSGANTTIGIVATDARLSKAECARLAQAGQSGLARAIWPSHTDMDGDLVFAAATGRAGRMPELEERIAIAAAASAAMARAIARAIYTANAFANAGT